MESWLKNLLIILLVLGLIVVFVWLLSVFNPMLRWALTAVVMIVLLLAVGKSGTEWGLFGALVDPQRGRYSLSQLQVVVWTVLVLSAWLAIVATRIVYQVPDPDGVLNVEIPREVLVLLGISATSLVSATAIKSNQRDRLYYGTRDKYPKWTDFWTGDEEGDKESIDIGKFQMFWFTVAAAVAYGMQISMEIGAHMAAAMPPSGVTDPKAVHEIAQTAYTALKTLPSPHASLVGVLGISHLGYLVNKVPERKRVKPSNGSAGGASVTDQ